jgi:Acetyltransferase (GNAT) domain
MTTPPLRPRAIALDTPHYTVRTLEPGDATETWRDWLADPGTARMLNTRPERLSAKTVRDYIASFNRATTHILGIFEKQTGRLVGIRAVYIDAARKEFLVNVLIGETGDRNRGARAETRTVMYRYFFDEVGLEAARCTVVAGNAPIMKVMSDNGWLLTRTESRPAAAGEGSIELHHFRLPRDVWRSQEGKA